jgi:hypothetical protein
MLCEEALKSILKFADHPLCYVKGIRQGCFQLYLQT